MKRIAVLTSGGDAPGMNAAIRAVTRTGISKGFEVFGVQQGFAGLLAGKFVRLGARDVGGIMQRGGTMLGSARCHEFKTEEGRAEAVRELRSQQIDGLVCIGGNGTQAGSNSLAQIGFPVVGVASTIDNDLYGSDITIGVDTALNIALEAIDRLKVTASSHKRAFLVEVMGRNCGYLALMAALAGGAEAVEIPERDTDPDALSKMLADAYGRGKPHALVVVAEGAKYNAEALMKYFRENRTRLGFDLRVTTLGHVQRGGTPTAFDRLLATRLGSAAADCLAQGKFGVLVGLHRDGVKTIPLAEVVGKQKPLDPHLLELERILAM